MPDEKATPGLSFVVRGNNSLVRILIQTKARTVELLGNGYL
jgi:hypothetical protein